MGEAGWATPNPETGALVHTCIVVLTLSVDAWTEACLRLNVARRSGI